MHNPSVGQHIQVDGIDTNYHDRGQGSVVMLLHGSAPGVSAWSNCHATLPVLSKQWRTVAPDIPGFGYTERKPEQIYGMKVWVSHLLAFMDALEIDKASFIGNSFGGSLTLALAISAPERVDRIVLMGSGGLASKVSEDLLAAWSYEPSESNMRELLLRFVYDPELVTDELVAQRHRASIEADAGEVFLQLMPPEKRKVGAPIPGLPEDAIAAIDKRVLFLHGREDRIVPPSNSLRMHQLISDSELHVFGRCGHWVQTEQAAKFQRLVVDFLADSEYSQ